MTEKNTSPLPDEAKSLHEEKQNLKLEMNFSEAIQKVMEGKKISRLSWPNKEYGLLKDGILTIYTNDKFHSWIVSDGDLTADDWIIVE